MVNMGFIISRNNFFFSKFTYNLLIDNKKQSTSCF